MWRDCAILACAPHNSKMVSYKMSSEAAQMLRNALSWRNMCPMWVNASYSDAVDAQVPSIILDVVFVFEKLSRFINK